MSTQSIFNLIRIDITHNKCITELIKLYRKKENPKDQDFLFSMKVSCKLCKLITCNLHYS